MQAATWYLGPLGDLRPLTVPEPGIQMDLVRYGGVHQSLSGARVADVLGHRYQYQFNWTHLEKAEWDWLEALHTRLVPGPHYLLNPMKKNLLSMQSSVLEEQIDNVAGVGIASANFPTREWDWPSALTVPGKSLRFASSGAQQFLRFDRARYTGILDEDLTGSIYMKATGAVTVQLVFDWYDRDGGHTSSSAVNCSVTTSWTRFSITANPPANRAAVLAVIIPITAQATYLAAPQLEFGTSATTWEIGGGSNSVILDQLTTSSRMFPRTDVSMTLLEM